VQKLCICITKPPMLRNSSNINNAFWQRGDIQAIARTFLSSSYADSENGGWQTACTLPRPSFAELRYTITGCEQLSRRCYADPESNRRPLDRRCDVPSCSVTRRRSSILSRRHVSSILEGGRCQESTNGSQHVRTTPMCRPRPVGLAVHHLTVLSCGWRWFVRLL